MAALCILFSAASAGTALTAAQVSRNSRRMGVQAVMVGSAVMLVAAAVVLVRGAFILGPWTATTTLLAIFPLAAFITFDWLRCPQPSSRIVLIRKSIFGTAATSGLATSLLITANLATGSGL